MTVMRLVASVIVVSVVVTSGARGQAQPSSPALQALYCDTLEHFLRTQAAGGISRTEMDKPTGRLLRATSRDAWSTSPDSACSQFARFTEFAPRSALRWYARWPAFITTPFKTLGIRGWTRLPIRANVTGRVLQAAGSTDRFLTLDVRLDMVQIEGSPCDWSKSAYLRQICPNVTNADAWKNIDRYLRIEAHGQAHRPGASPINPGGTVNTSGALRIDHDPPNFLELHVTPETRIEVVQ